MLPFQSTTHISPSVDTGKLQVMHLKRYWSKALLKRDGKIDGHAFADEWRTDTTLLSVIGISLEQTIKYLYQSAPTFDEFENWILSVAGTPDQHKIKKFNNLLTSGSEPEQLTLIEEVLTKDELDSWEKNGYLIIREAVSKAACDETIRVICEHIGVDRYDPATWYRPHPDRQGIMIQLFQHPILEQNRRSLKIKKVFEQLWNRTDLYVNTDRVGFNPPETNSFPFQGTRLHWDVSLDLPIPFGLQGILYLADTEQNQGAFTLVPGFQNRIDDWINGLPEGTDPRQEDLYALGAKPIAAKAGDFIIWQKALPHGSSPNTNSLPRFVQYFTYMPANEGDSSIWK